ncbi:energy transducer TonB [Sulfuritalea sp.]|uniref:energy transducer TonB n=1 Tax=Sulfuritalea sp. TaxID=2480090 RepID=UPI001AC3C4D7|nr:energy transducer TonB [Sulfuritalea sp.]MBN8476662.1 energy transducer TonB [Sulfuritalea sp.]
MGLLLPRLPSAGRPERPFASFTGAAAAHALLIALIAVVVPAEQLKAAIQPMAVRLVEILPELPKPKPPEPPRPKKLQPPAPLPLLTSNAVSDAAPAFVVQPQPPAPPRALPIDVAPAPAPVAITAARFDADYLHNPKPVYPHASRRLGEQGKVLLRVFVSAAGLAEKVEIKLGSGFARLDQAAEEAVSRWRFVPAKRGEQAIAGWVQVPITFQLES